MRIATIAGALGGATRPLASLALGKAGRGRLSLAHAYVVKNRTIHSKPLGLGKQRLAKKCFTALPTRPLTC